MKYKLNKITVTEIEVETLFGLEEDEAVCQRARVYR